MVFFYRYHATHFQCYRLFANLQVLTLSMEGLLQPIAVLEQDVLELIQVCSEFPQNFSVKLHVLKNPFHFFIAIDALLQQARANNQFNVFGYLNHIRTQRNHLVQTEEQYVFIHDALLEAIRSGVTEISRENLASYLEDFLLRPATSGEFEAMEFLPNESLIEAQFRLVMIILLYYYFK